ncbi:MAG: DUF3306 domain-containing protein [Burkholderiaceae bacterium]
MAADDFFARWSKRKTDATSAPAAMDPAVALNAGSTPAIEKPVPTLADVDGLTADSDYTAFWAKGVDESVKRSAMKKLFALPQFNIMDGLDIYIGDYSQPDPLPPGMLEALGHAKSALNPAQFFSKPVSQLLDKVEEHVSIATNLPEATKLEQDAAMRKVSNPTLDLHQEDTQNNIQNDVPADPQPALALQPDTLPPAAEIPKNEIV